MRLTNSQNSKDADAAAIHIRGVPSTLLMRNAAGHVARAAERRARCRRAVIFCGSGNNGGDGVAAALFLLRWGFQVRVLLTGSREKLTPDTREMERRLRELGGALEPFDPEDAALREELRQTGVIVDAMFGVGLSRPLAGLPLVAVEAINAAGAPVVAADIPSGVESDTGRVLGAAVRADETVTFSLAKPGHFLEPGCVYCGDITVADIGIPRDLVTDSVIPVRAVVREDLCLPRRAPVSHKGDYGRVLILAGSVGYTGAPALAALGALRAGAGLVSLGVPEPIYPIVAAQQREVMVFPLAADGEGRLSPRCLPQLEARLSQCDVCLCGPGLGRSGGIVEFVRQVARSCAGRLILDADALWAAAEDPAILSLPAKPPILTPHDGEFRRLAGADTGDRLGESLDFAREKGVALVRKGHRTLIAWPDGGGDILTTGNPGMAKGGTGDALAGILAGFAGQLPLEAALPTAVWLHGRAGDLAREKLGEYAMTASDLLAALPEAEQELLEG